MAVRQLHITEALVSFRRLGRIMHELTLEEVMAALSLEAATQRRLSLTTKLVDRAVQLESQITRKRLQEKFHGKST
jgi:hypothetical protein